MSKRKKKSYIFKIYTLFLSSLADESEDEGGDEDDDDDEWDD